LKTSANTPEKIKQEKSRKRKQLFGIRKKAGIKQE